MSNEIQETLRMETPEPADLGRLVKLGNLLTKAWLLLREWGFCIFGQKRYVHFKLREFDEVVRLSERIIELTEGTDARNSKLWAGPVHIEALLALGRLEEASMRLSAYAEMVSDCQSAHFSREVVRLERLLG